MTLTFHKPDFVCIGAQKAATTWLHNILQRVPEVFLPYFKETDYFTYPDQAVPEWLLRYRFIQFNRIYQNMLKSGQFERRLMEWLGHSCFAAYQDDGWYQGLFKGSETKICGDISPSYSTLSAGRVAYIRERLPHLKIIFIMRDPMARTWSSVDQSIKMGFLKDDRSQADLRQAVDSDLIDHHSDYARTIENWRRHYPESAFHFVFFDDVQEKPMAVLRDICDFIGVPFHEARIKDKALKPDNVTLNKDPMPDETAAYIAEKYLPMLEKLRSLVARKEVIDRWIAHMEEESARRSGLADRS